MTEQGISDWLASIGAFAPEEWWRFIVCSNAGRHDTEVLGIAFETSEGLQWSPRIGSGTWLVWFTRMDDEQRQATRDAGVSRDSQAFYGLGSLRALCPRGCERRIPREKWDQFLETARRVDPEWLDVSLLG